MTGVHDVLPPYKDDKEDSIYLKKMKNESAQSIINNVLGFELDRNPGENTIWLTEDRRIDIIKN